MEKSLEDEKREIYSFDVETIDDKEKDEKGEPKKRTVRVVLKKPSKRLMEEAEIRKAAKMSEYIRKGILTKNMLANKYANIGGAMSEKDAQNHINRYKELSELQLKWTRLAIMKTPSEEERKTLVDLTVKTNEIRREISEFEGSYSQLFNSTADVMAQKDEIRFFAVMLTYLQKEGDGEEMEIPYFEGEEYEDKLEDYYTKEDNPDDLHIRLSNKVAYIITLWRTGAAVSEKDFKEIERQLDEEDGG